MKISFSRRAVSVFFAALLLSGAALCQCPPVSPQPSQTGWPKGAGVLIYIVSNVVDGTFPNTQAIINAFSNWDTPEGSSLQLSSTIQSSTNFLPSTGYALVQVGMITCGDGKSACTQNVFNSSTGATMSSTTVVAASAPSASAFPQLMDHEVGHTYGQAECDGCGSATIMDGSSITTNSPTGPKCCDLMLSYDMTGGSYGTQSCGSGGGCESSWCAGPTENNPNCGGNGCSSGCCVTESGGGGGGGGGDECDGGDSCVDDGDCDSEDCSGGCCVDDCGEDACIIDDPIILDLTGNGYQLTSVGQGVTFDFAGNGTRVKMSWTAEGWDGGFLALDRNGNGRIDNGTELFGNVTPQPAPAPGKIRNGFLALAVYDLPANGGNGDGWITAQDAIFSKLVVWVDKNHNGISDPGELLTMQQAGIQAISLSYAPSPWKDAFGNSFRYQAQLKTNTSPIGWVWDVLLQQAASSTSTAAVTSKK